MLRTRHGQPCCENASSDWLMGMCPMKNWVQQSIFRYFFFLFSCFSTLHRFSCCRHSEKKMQCPNSPSMRSTARVNFEPRTPSTLMSRLVIHSPEAVRQRFNNADRPSTDLQRRLMHCSSSPKPTHPNLNMFLSGESKRIRMVRNLFIRKARRKHMYIHA
jgi:hypothetical protein